MQEAQAQNEDQIPGRERQTAVLVASPSLKLVRDRDDINTNRVFRELERWRLRCEEMDTARRDRQKNTVLGATEVYLGEDLINLFMESSRLLTKIDKDEAQLKEDKNSEKDTRKARDSGRRAFQKTIRRFLQDDVTILDNNVIDELVEHLVAKNKSEVKMNAYRKRVRQRKADIAKDRASWQTLLEEGTVPKKQDANNEGADS